MGSHSIFFMFLAYLGTAISEEVLRNAVIIDGATVITQTDENFICATIDWWSQEKCNYDQCPWGNTSLLNLDLQNPNLATAIKAFEHLRLRLGGSLQDQVVYQTESLKAPCEQFKKQNNGLFGFSKGCLPMSRWDELNALFNETGPLVTFGLNALYGRHKMQKEEWGGDWDPSNAREFIKYTISKGYKIDSWELGNELSGRGIGARVGAEQYAKDVINLKGIIHELYKNADMKPAIAAPGGFYERDWFAKFLQSSGSDVVDIVSYHMYNLGAGNDPNLPNKILSPQYLSQEAKEFAAVKNTISKYDPWASAWVSEAGGAYNSGGRLVSDTFVNSFWYLDQLGSAGKYGTKVYCRQTLIGGNYGLLNTTTYAPNPDFYSALLWHRLMGTGVLNVESHGSPYLRTYAHCTKGRKGVTILAINLSNQTRFAIDIYEGAHIAKGAYPTRLRKDSQSTEVTTRLASWIGIKVSDAKKRWESDTPTFREEYHLTPKDGYIRSQTMVLNGVPLNLTDDGEIPSLDPIVRNVTAPLSIAPLSIAFVVIPNFTAPACS